MKKTKNIIPLKELNLTDRFLFDEVMEDPEVHQAVLEIILGREIQFLDKNETEKELRVSPQIRAVRLDVFSMDEEKTVYSEEIGVKYMQAWEEKYYERQEGRQEGEHLNLIKLICKKMIKGYTAPEIAEIFEMDEDEIRKIYDVAIKYSPEYDAEKILEGLLNE